MPTAQIRPDILDAWKGPSLLIVGTHGECGDEQPLSGYYFREARFLRTLRFTVNGSRPWRCEASSLAPPELALRVNLVQQPPPESLSAGIVDRLRALVATIRE